MGETDREDGADRAIEDKEPKAPRMKQMSRRTLWRDPYRLAIVFQICLIAIIVILLVYLLFPYFPAADRIGLSSKHVFILPLGEAGVVAFLIRRTMRLLRARRGEDR